MMTLGFLRYIQENGLKIPDDISVITYDNTINQLLPWIDICAIEQNTTQLANEACNVLFDKIKGGVKISKDISLKPNLVINNSIKDVFL